MSDGHLHLDGAVLPRHRLLNAVLTVLIGASALEAHQSPAIRHSGHVDVNGSKLYYEVRGSNIATRRTPVILVHGRSLDRTSWDRQFSMLSKFFTTYRYDLRGHGLSDAATGPLGPQNDLIGFMDALGIDKAYLVGQSLGGNVVTEVAASHSHRVEKLVLIDSGIDGTTYSRLNQVTAPTLVMVGEFDHPAFQAAADALHQQIQRSTKVVIPGAGHMSHQDEPLEVTWEILEFLLK